MAYRVVIALSAECDLTDIVDFIAADNPRRALSFVDELQGRTAKTLAGFPLSGRAYESGTRFIVLGNYVVLYEIDEDAKTVTVLHVFPGGRNWREA